MKILMINGSPHPHGCTDTALHEMEQVFQTEGIETELLTLGTDAVRGCTRPAAAASALVAASLTMW